MSHSIRRERPTTRRSGFTLVEILLTLLLMAGIMVTVTQILTNARQVRDQIHNVQERQLIGPAILDLIERDLRALHVYNRLPEELLRVEDRVLAGLDADKLDFVSTTDSLVPFRRYEREKFRRSDLNEVGYRLRVSPASDDFLEIYRREDFGVDEEALEGGSFTLLHDRVKGFDIQIYDEDGPEAEPLEEWSANPDDEERIGLPLRLEITLTLELQPRQISRSLRSDLREMTYVRTVRLPASLILANEVRPLPVIPQPPTPTTTEVGGPGGDTTTTTTGGAGGSTVETFTDGPGGGGDGLFGDGGGRGGG